jgi:hypothetical protein
MVARMIKHAGCFDVVQPDTASKSATLQISNPGALLKKTRAPREIARRPRPEVKRTQGKISPEVFEVAASYRDCTSAQLTTFQNAFT